MFSLSTRTRHAYLHHRSELGEFFLASDTVVPTLTNRALGGWRNGISAAETETFLRQIYTIGGSLVFPGNRIDGKQTINGARGFRRTIADRMDLTLECIRRHYIGEPNPLEDVLARYGGFFALFGDFRGYVEFFLLEDLATKNGDQVSFFTPFDDFTTPALPQDLETYVEYRRRSIEFITARNGRVARWDAAH